LQRQGEDVRPQREETQPRSTPPRTARPHPISPVLEDADSVVVSTDGDNTNLVIGQVAQKRFANECVVVRLLDPARTSFYRARGLRVVCRHWRGRRGA